VCLNPRHRVKKEGNHDRRAYFDDDDDDDNNNNNNKTVVVTVGTAVAHWSSRVRSFHRIIISRDISDTKLFLFNFKQSRENYYSVRYYDNI